MTILTVPNSPYELLKSPSCEDLWCKTDNQYLLTPWISLRVWPEPKHQDTTGNPVFFLNSSNLQAIFWNIPKEINLRTARILRILWKLWPKLLQSQIALKRAGIKCLWISFQCWNNFRHRTSVAFSREYFTFQNCDFWFCFTLLDILYEFKLLYCF